MRVVLISTVHSASDVRIFEKEARTLASAGYDVHYLVPAPESKTVNGIEVHALPVPRNRFDRIVRVQLAAFRKALQLRADAYHIHDPELLLSVVALKLLTRRPVLYDVHENVRGQILSKSWIPPLLRTTISLAYGAFERVALRAVDAVILANREVSEQKAYRRHRACVVVRNYPSIEQAVAASHPGDSRNGQRQGAVPTFVYLGGVSRSRGTLELLRAASLLRARGVTAFRLLLIGPFQPISFRDEVVRLVEQEELGDIVQIAGPIPYALAIPTLSACVAGVATLLPEPNYLTNQPTKLFEYMLAGIPVIASDFPVWREVVETEQCGVLVDPTDSESIADAMHYVLTHENEARAMGERGRTAVLARYSWSKEGEKLLQVYRTLLGADSPNPDSLASI